MRLGEFLSQPLPEWDWRSHDCCRWVDRWVQAHGYASPIAALGLHYGSERGALLAIRRGGGLMALWGRGMNAAGVPLVRDSRAGDVAVIRRQTMCGLGEAMAICTGDRWASLAIRGLEIGPADPLKVWRP